MALSAPSTPSTLASPPSLLPKPSSPPPPIPVSASTATTAVTDATATHDTTTTHDAIPTASTHDNDNDAPSQPPPVMTTPPRSPRTSSTISSPPYWHSTANSPIAQHNNNRLARPPGHARIPSADSASLMHAIGAITLRDNEADDAPRSNACWARSVSVVDYVIIDGSALRFPALPRSSISSNGGGGRAGASSCGGGGSFIRLPGAFVSWNIRVETLTGSYMTISKRYSEFDHFRSRLIRSFPGFEAAMPELPPKSVIAKFRPKFLEKRRAGLQYFLNCILLNPEFSGSPVLKDFLFN